MAEIFKFHAPPERKQPSGPGNSGEPPHNNGMEARVAKLEAALPNLATKVDMAELRTEMHKEFTAQTWRIIGAMFTFGGLLSAAVFFIARNVH